MVTGVPFTIIFKKVKNWLKIQRISSKIFGANGSKLMKLFVPLGESDNPNANFGRQCIPS